jgi:hypothetical protein
MESEFGKGLTYCLALFLCHSERDYFMRDNEPKIISKPDLWFNGSSDHLYDLQIPKNLPFSLKKRLTNLQQKVIHWGHGFDKKNKPTEEDKSWAIKEAKELLRLIDKFFGIKTEKGDWE